MSEKDQATPETQETYEEFDPNAVVSEATAEGQAEGEVLNFPDSFEQVPDVETPPIRKLRDGDSYRVAGILPKVLADENLRWSFQLGDPTMAMLGGVSAALEHAPREIRLFVADLIGITADRQKYRDEDTKRQAREIQAMRDWRRRRGEAEAEGEEALKAFLEEDPDEPVVYKLKAGAEIDELVEDEIVEKMEELPPGTTQAVLTTIMERDDFLPFVTTSMQLYEAGKRVSSRFSTLSSRLSGSQKPTS